MHFQRLKPISSAVLYLKRLNNFKFVIASMTAIVIMVNVTRFFDQKRTLEINEPVKQEIMEINKKIVLALNKTMPANRNNLNASIIFVGGYQR
jgi:hypothetical protein